MAYTTIDDPSEYFQAAIYSGNSSTLAVTSQGNATIAPDWIWIKRRSSASTHALFDSTRGRAKSLGSEASDAEYNTADTAKDLISFDTDGFTVGPANQRNTNGASQTFVAWQWKANGGTRTTVSESGSTPASGLQVNTTAGFSIVDYTGVSGSSAVFAHGLGALCEMVIIKNRTDGNAWVVQHKDLASATHILNLQGTDAAYDDGTSGITGRSTTTVTVGSGDGVNKDNSNYIAYCFTSIQGYSKIGSYVGNGDASNGTFVYTGFKPAWVMTKKTTSASNFDIDDSARNPFNPTDKRLFTNFDAADVTGVSRDFLSNGFKMYNTHGGQNTSGQTYIYMAFAEHPFVSSQGVPTTAR